ncbi:isomerase, partial [Pseudomonas sp. MPR-R1B]
MQLEIFQVDAFSSTPFGGNPAAVIPLQQWLADDVLQRIAEENNLSETAYFVRNGEAFDLRWFTPAVEVDLCGHATLAAAWVLFEQLGEQAEVLRFNTRSGELRVSRNADGLLAMDFPAKQPVAVEIAPGLLEALGLSEARALYRTDDYVVVIDDASLIEGLKPDFVALSSFDVRGIAVTAAGRGFDFV